MSIFQVAVDTVNYKLTSEKFIKLKETFGFIENTSDTLIEFAITTGKPVFNDKGNQLVVPNGKLSYELEEGQGIYARPVDRLSGEINVSKVRINNSDIDGNYYTKVEVDNNFVKKDGNKVLSDENFTNAEKEKLAGFNYATENPLANGIANVGISTKIAREDHVHPVQTSISGNAGTATKLQTPRNITLTGDATGTISFDGSADVEIAVTVSRGGSEGGVPTTTQVIAGSGLNGGGALSENVTLNIISEDDGIVINEDNIKLNIVDNLTTDSATRAGSARQLKILDESKLGKTEKAQSATTADSCEGNSATSTKLATARAITLNGAITGTTNFDGSTDATIETNLSNLDGSKVTALTGYTKASESTAIVPTDNLLVALGKLEKGLEGVAPSILSTQGNPFSLHYCTKSEYDSLDKIQDDSTIYLVLDESTGEIVIKVYRP